MLPDQIVNNVTKYTAGLQVLGYKALKADTSTVLSEADKFCHLLWMCEQIHAFVSLGEQEKANRWLGFIQGVMWSHDLQTIDQMRDDNRPIEPT